MLTPRTLLGSNTYSAITFKVSLNSLLFHKIRANNFTHLLRVTVKHPSKLNILRTFTYPLLKIVTSLRILIVVYRGSGASQSVLC